MRRLQGEEFVKKAADLQLVEYFESTNGNICGFYAYPGEETARFTHWMNDNEKKEFLSLKFDIPKREAYSDNVAYVLGCREALSQMMGFVGYCDTLNDYDVTLGTGLKEGEKGLMGVDRTVEVDRFKTPDEVAELAEMLKTTLIGDFKIIRLEKAESDKGLWVPTNYMVKDDIGEWQQEAGKIIMTRFVGSPDPCYVVFDTEQEMQAETAKWEKLGRNLDNLQDLDFNFEENIGEER